MKGKINIHNKGKRGEYVVRDLIRGFGWEARRTPMSGAIDGWKGDITAKDFPFFVEVKNTEKTTFLPWFKKAEDQSMGKPPIIAWVSHGQVYCFGLLSDVMMIMKTGASPIVKFPKAKRIKQSTDESDSKLMFSKTYQVRRKHK
jgi:hypothetical protein